MKKISLIKTLLNCDINGKKFILHGEISGLPGGGYCEASVSFSQHELPKNFPVSILSYVLITGYPSMSLSIGNAQNLFTKESINFTTKRTLDLGSRGSLTTTYFSKDRSTSDEVITFNVQGHVNLPQLIDMNPTVETWIPNGAGKFNGEMLFMWTGENGEKISASAMSQYHLQTSEVLKNPQIRIIDFSLSIENGIFTQKEHIKLYDKKEWSMLSDKTAAA